MFDTIIADTNIIIRDLDFADEYAISDQFLKELLDAGKAAMRECQRAIDAAIEEGNTSRIVEIDRVHVKVMYAIENLEWRRQAAWADYVDYGDYDYGYDD